MERSNRLNYLVQLHVDRGASAAELRELEQLLVADPDAAVAFAQAAQFDAILERCLNEQQRSRDLVKLLASLGSAEPADRRPLRAAEDRCARLPAGRRLSRREVEQISRNGERHTERPGPTSPNPTSPVLGFLNGLLHAGQESPAANALTWMVLAVVCSGIVMTIFFCVSLIYHGVGVNVHLDSQVTKNPPAPAQPDDGSGVSGAGGREANLTDPPSSVSRTSPVGAPQSMATVARLIHTVDCHWAIGSHSPHLGDDLEPGRKLALLSGLAEVMFESGVRVLLEGPATLEISSRKTARLRLGKMTVRVEDPDARGFAVETPGMKYTDLGTEFGVSVAKDGTQDMAVFRGKVLAEQSPEQQSPEQKLQPGPAGRERESRHSRSGWPTRRSEPLILTASQAIRVVTSERSIERVAINEKQFVRALPAPELFPLFGTGAGLARGAADPHWQIIAVSVDPDFKPQPAIVVLQPDQAYVSESRDKGQWVALDAEAKDYPDECRWTYRTKFDLTGFDVNSALIEGQFAADDYIAELRLNGRVVPLVTCGDYTKYYPVRIEKGFVEGQNVLEITLVNRSDPKSTPSRMALCVQLNGTARRSTERMAAERD
jgi:hypothetical protein